MENLNLFEIRSKRGVNAHVKAPLALVIRAAENRFRISL